MSQPRYAPSGIASTIKGFSPRGTLFGTLIAALAVMLAAPVVAGASHRTAAVAAPPASASTPQPASNDDQIDQLDLTGLQPSTVSTAQPGKAKVVPVSNDGLIGPAGATGELGIPVMVLKAYKLSAADLAKEQPSCRLPWWLLAGIGHTESGHAEGGRLYPDGTTRGRILGPRLNGGIAGDAVISDTDHGLYDGDTVYDRAVGPMQFIPSTWKTWGADGNHDGKKDPNNIYDATLAAGRYLCADGRNLATTAGLQAAVLSYNHSQAYLDTVLAWGYAYRSGASSLPDQTDPINGDVTAVRPPLGAKPPHKPIKLPSKPKPTKSGTPTSSPTHSASPTGSASPTHSASPTGSTSSSPTCTATPTGSGSPTGTLTSSMSKSDVSSAATTAAAMSSADGNSVSAGGSGSSSSSASSTATSTPTASCTR